MVTSSWCSATAAMVTMVTVCCAVMLVSAVSATPQAVAESAAAGSEGGRARRALLQADSTLLNFSERRAVSKLAAAILHITSGAGLDSLLEDEQYPEGGGDLIPAQSKRNAELINSLLRHQMPDLQKVGRRRR